MGDFNINENNEIIEKEIKGYSEVRLLKKTIIKIISIVILTSFLIFLINYKKEVNNGMTKFYYYISIIGTIFSVIGFIFLFIKNFKKSIKEKIYTFIDIFNVFVIACTLFQSFFVFGYFKANVDGSSMFPTLTNDQTLIVRSSNKNIDNFDIVVCRYDIHVNRGSMGLKDGDLLVKRVIAKGGDSFSFVDGVLYLNGNIVNEDYINIPDSFKDNIDLKKYLGLVSGDGTLVDAIIYDEEKELYIVKEGYYFLMGDNRGSSNDSRLLGFFKKEQIIGKVIFEINGIFDWERL